MEISYKPKVFIFLLAGITGVWFLFSPGTLFANALIVTVSYFFIVSHDKPEERKSLAVILSLAVGLRLIGAVLNYYLPWGLSIGADFIPDARAYSASGQYIAEVISKTPMPTIDGNEPAWLAFLQNTFKGQLGFDYRLDYFARYIGFIYTVFGYSPLTVKLLNVFFSIFTAILLYILTKYFFSDKAAKVALLLNLFWPSLFLWSISGIKETLLFFLLTLFIFIYIKFQKQANVLELILATGILISNNEKVILALFFVLLFYRGIKGFKKQLFFYFLLLVLTMKIAYEATILMRAHYLIPLRATLFLCLLFYFIKRGLRYLPFILISFFLFASLFLPGKSASIERYLSSFCQEIIGVQKSQLEWAGSAYRIYPDRYYEKKDKDAIENRNITVSEFIWSYFKGMGYVLFAPFPWSAEKIIQLIPCLQMMAGYFLIPFFIFGTLFSLRYKNEETVTIMVFLLLVASIFALFEGNVGTLLRHRGILISFSFIFVAGGIINFLDLLSRLLTRK